MKEYTLKKLNYSPGVFDNVEILKMDTYKWMDNDYRPKAQAQLFYDDENIYIRQQAWEKTVRIKNHNMHESVWQDSCMEFFIRPVGAVNYLNFEVNAAGVMLIGLGNDRYFRVPVGLNQDIFCVKASTKDEESYNGETWSLEYKIPFKFLEAVFGKFDKKGYFEANVYKCGDLSVFEHYGMWNEIEIDKADFHTSKYFGRMYFEEK